MAARFLRDSVTSGPLSADKQLIGRAARAFAVCTGKAACLSRRSRGFPIRRKRSLFAGERALDRKIARVIVRPELTFVLGAVRPRPAGEEHERGRQGEQRRGGHAGSIRPAGETPAAPAAAPSAGRSVDLQLGRARNHGSSPI